MSGVALAGLLALASLTGSGLGVLAGAGLVMLLLRPPHDRRRPVRARATLKTGRTPDPGYQQLTDDFATHAGAVQREVSEFADQLADGDPHLRARLRVFESGSGDGVNR